MVLKKNGSPPESHTQLLTIAPKDGRLLMRFYNRCTEADNYAYEIQGIMYSDIPADEIGTEEWIPNCVTKEFEKWMTSEMPFFTSMKEFFNYKKKASKTND